MGQGVSTGAIAGVATDMMLSGMTLDFWTHATTFASCCAAGLAVDLTSDLTARTGTIVVPTKVMLNASDTLKHVSTYYCNNDSHPISRLIRQKHEWIVLEATSGHFYVVQKSPKSGDVVIDISSTVRGANDLGLKEANRPLHSGETSQPRADTEFDLPDDLQVAYVIAWLRKEDPRWALSTENSRHFATRLRMALLDF